MKKLLVALCAVLFSFSALAEEVFITNSSDKNESWYGYPDSFSRIKDAWTVLVAKRYPNSGKPDVRFYVAVKFTDCKSGYGSLYARDNENYNWEVISQFAVEANRTVGDEIAKQICEAGAQVEAKTKAKVKKTIPVPTPTAAK